MLNRRDFLAAAAAALAFPRELLAQVDSAPRFPDSSLLQTDAEAFWKQIRQQFPIPAGSVYLNNGTCGSSPYPVLKAVFDSFLKQERLEESDPEKYPLFGYGTFDEYSEPLARFIGCDKQEVAIVRNATEANAIMANGLDLNPGDEVLMSDQEHPGGEGPWNLRAKRQGIVIRKFTLPLPPKSPAEVLEAINDAITPKTRVIFVSHITTVTGVVLPVKEISALARERGIVSMIDGAQVSGMMGFNVREIGCDMYSSSPHKWLMAPKGTGFLYLRDEIIDRVWSHIATEGWDNPKLRAARFQQYGSANLPLVVGMIESIRVTQNIGLAAIERRGRELADYLLKGMMEPVGGHRAARARTGGLSAEGDDGAWRGVVDIAESGDAVCDRGPERSAGHPCRFRELAVARAADPNSWRCHSAQDSALDPLLPAESGDRPLS